MAPVRPGPGGRPPGWQQEHARRYLATGGQDGHNWEGVSTLLLTTTGRRSGTARTTPLIYGRDRFTSFVPTPDTEGQIEELPFLAGQGVGLIHDIRPAAQIIDILVAEAASARWRLGRVPDEGYTRI